jgi:hypothetical protein
MIKILLIVLLVIEVAPRAGLEPATWRLTAARSAKLSYRGIYLLLLYYFILILEKQKFRFLQLFLLE